MAWMACPIQVLGGFDDACAECVIPEGAVGEERVAAGSRKEGGSTWCCVAVKDGGRQVQSAGKEVDATSIIACSVGVDLAGLEGDNRWCALIACTTSPCSRDEDATSISALRR